LTLVALVAAHETATYAQQPEETRQAVIEQAQAAKDATLEPYVPSKSEELLDKVQNILAGTPKWHPFFQSAYSGGGFTLGAGYQHFVSAYSFFDVRGSYTLSNYKRLEAEYVAPRLFNRRGHLSVVGGWREAPEVGFYGLSASSDDNRTNYLFRQPYGSATLTLWPTRRNLVLIGGAQLTRWTQESGEGSYPSVETVYTPETLPGLGAQVTYFHTQGTVGYDWRTSPGYTRRGGFYGVTVHDYADRDDRFGFDQVNYEAMQHFPILRESWILAFHGEVQTTFRKDGQDVPFFMMPAVGGGSSLRGFPSWRFRDRHTMLMQAEWRIPANRFFETAFFYDTGKSVGRTADLDFDHLRSDYGVGFRFHGPFATPLRVEVARSNEGLSFIFASSPVF